MRHHINDGLTPNAGQIVLPLLLPQQPCARLRVARALGIPCLALRPAHGLKQKHRPHSESNGYKASENEPSSPPRTDTKKKIPPQLPCISPPQPPQARPSHTALTQDCRSNPQDPRHTHMTDAAQHPRTLPPLSHTATINPTSARTGGAPYRTATFTKRASPWSCAPIVQLTAPSTKDSTISTTVPWWRAMTDCPRGMPLLIEHRHRRTSAAWYASNAFRLPVARAVT
jgi:hypothetical protein